ncbi:MAG: hypothetical protein U9R47_09525 [Actinomycetota bacterium]|nr:hypothetical protein [Actinomycetota bacterium]
MELVFDTNVLITISCGHLFSEVEAEWPGILVAPGAVAGELKDKITNDVHLRCGRYPLGRPWLQDPVMFNDEEHDRIEVHRKALAAPSDSYAAHAGEAEVLHYCETHENAIAILDDRDARTRAKYLGLRSWNTEELMRRLVGSGRITCEESFDAYNRMVCADRLAPGLLAADFCVVGCSSR